MFSEYDYTDFFRYTVLASFPLNDFGFAQLRGGLVKGDFYFKQIFIFH